MKNIVKKTRKAKGAVCYIGIILALICIEVFSSIESAHGGLLDKMGTHSNYNRPKVWQDQLGSYASGGSIYIRTPTSDLQLLSFDMPSIDAGCGGINVNFGGFGYISGNQIQKLFKNIGSSALSYGVMLTIKSISPQISDLLENLEAMARFMNSQNINSCQMGASIAAGLFLKNEQSHRLACQARKMGGGSGGVGDKLSSYFTAREDCNDGEKATATNNEDKDKDKPLLPAEYNLVWYALKKEGANLSRGDKEFLMSLSGTVIAEKGKGGNISYKHKSSLMKGSGMINAIVFGGDLQSFKVYACDKEEDCLHPREVSHKWSNKDSMYAKVIEVMQSLEDKILKENEGDNQSLDAKEKDLLSRSSMPILNLISLNAGLKGHGVKDTISEYAEVVAFDYTIGYLDDLTDFVYKALSNLEHSQIEGDTIKDFKEEIRSIRKSLFHERSNAMARLHTITSVKEITRQKEQQVFAMFADYRIKNGDKE